MKNKVTLTKVLGLKQQDVANLLGVNRAQWSMYESGKRNLPTAATLKLAELLQQVKTKQPAARQKPDVKTDHAVIEHLQRLLKENEYQRAVVGRKITALLKKQEAAQRLIELSEVLKTTKAETKIAEATANSISVKASKTGRAEINTELITLEIRREVLQHEKILLESKISKKLPKP